MGGFVYHAGYIPGVRGERESVEKCMKRAREWLEQGVSVLFFPEGTRSHDGVGKPFKQGAFQLAIDAGVGSLPCGISGPLEARPPGRGKDSRDVTTLRILARTPMPTA